MPTRSMRQPCGTSNPNSSAMCATPSSGNGKKERSVLLLVRATDEDGVKRCSSSKKGDGACEPSENENRKPPRERRIFCSLCIRREVSPAIDSLLCSGSAHWHLWNTATLLSSRIL